MTLRDKKKAMIVNVSNSIIFSHSLTYNDLADTAIIAIPLSQIPPDGLPARELRILMSDNLLEMKIGQFNLVFVYDTAN